MEVHVTGAPNYVRRCSCSPRSMRCVVSTKTIRRKVQGMSECKGCQSAKAECDPHLTPPDRLPAALLDEFAFSIPLLLAHDRKLQGTGRVEQGVGGMRTLRMQV